LEQLQILEVFKEKNEFSPLQLAKIEMKKRRRAGRTPARKTKPESTW
jgi:hypothetical protein